MAELITSVSNPRLKAAMALRNRRDREHEKLMLVEGTEELRVALASGAMLVTLFECPALSPPGAGFADVAALARQRAGERIELGEAAFAKLAYRDDPDGLIGVFRPPTVTLPTQEIKRDALVLVMERIEKPGNIGAMLRTADAAGVDLVIACGTEGEPLADITNPNVVRASKGAVFSTPLAVASNAEAHEWLAERGFRCVAASPDAALGYTEVNFTGRVACVVGEEARGLSPFWQARADTLAQIPMHGRVNSLNVSVACALLLYEAKRQRKHR